MRSQPGQPFCAHCGLGLQAAPRKRRWPWVVVTAAVAVALALGAVLVLPRFLQDPVYSRAQFEALQNVNWAPVACQDGFSSDVRSTGRDHIDEVDLVGDDIADQFRYPSLQIACDNDDYSSTVVGYYDKSADARHDISLLSQAKRMTVENGDHVTDLLTPEHGELSDGSMWVALSMTASYDGGDAYPHHVLLVQRKNFIIVSQYGDRPWSETHAQKLERMLIRDLGN